MTSPSTFLAKTVLPAPIKVIFNKANTSTKDFFLWLKCSRFLWEKLLRKGGRIW